MPKRDPNTQPRPNASAPRGKDLHAALLEKVQLDFTDRQLLCAVAAAGSVAKALTLLRNAAAGKPTSVKRLERALAEQPDLLERAAIAQGLGRRVPKTPRAGATGGAPAVEASGRIARSKVCISIQEAA